MRHLFDSFKASLQRAPQQESKKCSFNKYPRFGHTARRADDCVIDCANFEECEKANMKGETLEDT